MSLRVGMSMCICVGCWMRVLVSSAAVKIGVSSHTVYTAQLHRWSSGTPSYLGSRLSL